MIWQLFRFYGRNSGNNFVGILEETIKQGHYKIQGVYFIIVLWADCLELDQVGFSGLLGKDYNDNRNSNFRIET